jgi:hypothetical protein
MTTEKAICDRCGGARFRDHAIHNGASVRRDCAECGHTQGFPVWHGQREAADDRPPASPPHVSGSPTSLAAAITVAPRAGKLAKLVLYAIREAGARGATDEELRDTLGLRESTCRARRRELELAGMVRDSGRTRLSSAGCAMKVWITKPEG